jgi:hypothetical protein
MRSDYLPRLHALFLARLNFKNHNPRPLSSSQKRPQTAAALTPSGVPQVHLDILNCALLHLISTPQFSQPTPTAIFLARCWNEDVRGPLENTRRRRAIMIRMGYVFMLSGKNVPLSNRHFSLNNNTIIADFTLLVCFAQSMMAGIRRR